MALYVVNKPGRYKTKVKNEFISFFWKRGIEVRERRLNGISNFRLKILHKLLHRKVVG